MDYYTGMLIYLAIGSVIAFAFAIRERRAAAKKRS
jgi:hypothetical protein